ncbi:MAG: hypothetical protein ACRCYY_06310 [Trueperaceae bacterium]
MSRFMSYSLILALLTLLSSCGLFTPTLDKPAALCEEGQVSTEAEPCTPRPTDNGDTGADDGGSDPVDPNPDPASPTDPVSPADPTNPTEPTVPPATPASCENTTASVEAMPGLNSETTLKSCYTPGTSDSVFVSYKLEDSSVELIKPTIVFDIVKSAADSSTTSVAYSLLAAYPSANPDVFRDEVTKEDLLAGLETAVALKFKSSAVKGDYTMVISLFKDTDAYDGANLVGRVFYRFAIK